LITRFPSQVIQACKTTSSYPTKADRSPQWTNVHSHFLQMGGYIFHFGGCFSYVPIGDLLGYPPAKPAATDEEAPDSQTGDTEPNPSQFPVVSGEVLRLALLQQKGKKEEIMDKSKANGFARAIAYAQMLWFGVSLAGRFAEGLAVTKLEIASSAYILVTILTYFFWMEKPLDVDCPLTVMDSASEGASTHDTAEPRPCGHKFSWTPSE
jgi:hypothetical protein